MIVAICDDDKKDRVFIRQCVYAYNNGFDIEEFESAQTLLNSLSNEKRFDIIFIDIEMPILNGWDAAAHIKRTYPNTYIIMITVIENRGLDSFDRVDWFIPKPASMNRIHEVLNKAHEKLSPAILTFSMDNEPLVLNQHDIVYFEIIKNHLYIYTLNTEKGKPYKVRRTLKEIKNITLPCFVSTHSSYLVNLKFYEKLSDDKTFIILSNGDRIPLSRMKKHKFKETLREFLRSRKRYE